MAIEMKAIGMNRVLYREIINTLRMAQDNSNLII